MKLKHNAILGGMILFLAGLSSDPANAGPGFVSGGWHDDGSVDCDSGCDLDVDRDSHGAMISVGHRYGDDFVYTAEALLGQGMRGISLSGGYNFTEDLSVHLGYQFGRERGDLDIDDPEGGTDAQSHGPFVEASYALPVLDFGRLAAQMYLRAGSMEGKATRSLEENDTGGGEAETRYSFTSFAAGLRFHF